MHMQPSIPFRMSRVLCSNRSSALREQYSVCICPQVNFNDFWFCDPFSKLTYKAGIYAWATDVRSMGLWMSPTPSAVFIVPGFRVGCTPYYALAQSTLECLFNATCINTTAHWISNLPSSSWPKPLNSSLPSKYSVSEEMTTIYDQMMTDTWKITKQFSSYYALCAPTECTYTYIGRFDLLYLVTMLTGLFGGLIATLRLISPFLIQVYYHFRTLCTKRRQRQAICQPHIDQGIVRGHLYESFSDRHSVHRSYCLFAATNNLSSVDENRSSSEGIFVTLRLS